MSRYVLLKEDEVVACPTVECIDTSFSLNLISMVRLVDESIVYDADGSESDVLTLSCMSHCAIS